MRRVYRLTRPEYAPGLDGEGARRVGGRWNSPGRAAVYCAGSVALAALEVFVHLPPAMRRPEKLPHLVLVALDVPQATPGVTLADSDLPPPGPVAAYRAIGDRWLDAGQALWLDVPSLVIPYERNLVLNPDHPDMAQVHIADSAPFRFDPRMGG